MPAAFQCGKLWRWGLEGSFYRETFRKKLIRSFTQQLIHISKLRAEPPAGLHPTLRQAEPIWGGSLLWKGPAKPSFSSRRRCLSLLLPAIKKFRVFKKLMSALVGVCSVTSAGEQPGSSAAQAGSRQGAEGVCL